MVTPDADLRSIICRHQLCEDLPVGDHLDPDFPEDGLIEFTAEFMAFGDNVMAALKGTEFTDLDLEEADACPVEVLTNGVGRIDRYPARKHFAGLPRHLQSYGQVVCVFNAPDEDDWRSCKARSRTTAPATAMTPLPMPLNRV